MEKEKQRVLPKHVKDMSQDELERTLRKKKECNAKALAVVEKMIDNPVDADWFLSQLKHIRQNHFQDAIEERAIVRLCGYPLCSNKLQNVPAHQYHISLKTNRVYDTTERRKFCSNFCYKAANYLENQLLTSPLWFVDPGETVFTLMPTGFKSSVGVQIGLEKDLDLKTGTETEFTSINQFALDSLADITPGTADEMKPKSGAPRTSETSKDYLTKLSEIITRPNPTDEEKNNLKTVSTHPQEADPVKNVVPVSPEHKLSVTQTISKVSFSLESRIIKPRVVAATPPSPASLVLHIEQCLHEWFNLETLIFLLGEKTVKESIIEMEGSVKEYNQLFNNTRSMWDPKLQDRYDKICRRLSLMELEDDMFDGDIQGTTQLKPLPDYRDVQEDGKSLVLKVNAFYQGKLTYVENPTSAEETTDDIDHSTHENMMPLVDSHSQKALRRKLVIDRLKRVLTDWSGICGIPTNDIVAQVRAIVNTFSLAAHNITFKPLEWRFLGLIIVDMLALKNPSLKAKIESKQGQKYQTPILASFHQDQSYINQLLTSLTNLDNLLQFRQC